MTALRRVKLNYDEYLDLEARTGEKHEYLDGEAWAMAGGTPAHADLSLSVGAELRGLVRGGRCRAFSSDLKLRVLATGLSTYADAVVVCGPVETAAGEITVVTNPTVIVEVLSDSTESYDRGAKFAHYRRMPSLRAYVLVSQHEQRIEVFNRDGAKWTFTEGLEGASVPLPCLDGELSVAAVYAGVTLAE